MSLQGEFLSQYIHTGMLHHIYECFEIMTVKNKRS